MYRNIYLLMKPLKPLTLILATIMTVALTTFGRIERHPIDVESLTMEYYHIYKSNNRKEEYNKWASTKSEAELAAIPIVLGYSLINMIEGDALTDAIHYEEYVTAIRGIEKGVKAIENSGMYDALYLTSADASLMPVRYVLANAYDMVYRYADADSAYILTSREIGRDFGVDSEEFVFWTNQCAQSIQRKNKNYVQAIHLLLPAKEAALQSHEVSDSTACNFLISLAQNYKQAGNHTEAKKLAIEAEKRCDNDHKRIFNVSNMLGELYWIEGNRDLANEYYDKVEHNAISLKDFFAAGINYANTMRQTGFHESAESTLTALGKYRESEELSQEDLFNYYESSGVLYTFTNPDKSADYFRKAEEYINGISYPELIRHIFNSQVYPNVGNNFKIISALDRAEMIYNLFIGNEPRLLNELLLLKGYYLMAIHDYENARKYLETAYSRMLDYTPGDPQLLETFKYLSQLEEIEGEDIRRGYYLGERIHNAKLHGESSDIYIDAIADILHYCLQERNLEASNHYLGIYSKNRPDSFDTRCYEYRLKCLQGDYAKAEKLLDKLSEKFPNERHVINLMRQRFYADQHSPRIIQVATDVFANYRNELIHKLLFMSNRERRNMEEEFRSRRDEIIHAVSFTPELAELAFDYSLFSKGLLFHTQNEILGLLANNDSARIEVATINGLKADLTRAVNSNDRKLVNSIQQSIDSRERYLIDDFLSRENFSHRFEQYASKRLMAEIDTTELMLDFVQYDDSMNTNLACFTIEPDSPVRFVEFGNISGLDDAQICRQIWTRLHPFLKRGKTIYFSTDGILNTMPIEYAKDEDGVTICEKYDLHRVFHLSNIRKDEGIGNRVEAIGVADHNSPGGQARGLDDVYRGNWNDLPGVETELYHIAKRLDSIGEYHIAFNDEASEAYVKSLSGQPITTLHISTHGFYRGEDDLTKAYNDTTDFDHNIAKRTLMSNRSSVSGLVLRNGNLSWKSEKITDDEDNILTSEEIELMTFPNLQLTVLSACDSGLGDNDSDGIWGLQRAFRIAGSKSLICSLTKVDDYWTTQFMDAFYEQATQGKTIYESFHKALRWLRNELPDNPEIWSAFILIE